MWNTKIFLDQYVMLFWKLMLSSSVKFVDNNLKFPDELIAGQSVNIFSAGRCDTYIIRRCVCVYNIY